MSVEDKTESLSALMNERHLKIPPYQRGYAWEKEQFEDFTHDLERSTEERQSTSEHALPTHYLGTIVLKRTGTNSESGYDEYELTDGQQRVTTAMLTADELSRAIEAHAPRVDDRLSEQLKDQRSININGLVQEHIRDDRYRDYYLTLSEKDHTIFDQLLSGADPDTLEKSTHSQRRLCAAKRHLKRWLSNKSTELDDEEYANFLIEASKALRNDFRVIPYFVQSETEAGLMFELVNDRGKDLTTLDKIKSHLIYCASRYDDKELAKEIERNFTTAYEYLGDIDDSGVISSFTTDFWIAFSGERDFRDESGESYGKENINRRVKHNRHAPFEDEEKFRNWTGAFLDDLVGCAEAYSKIHNPDGISAPDESLDSVRNDIVRTLKSINYLGTSSNFDALLMAAYNNLGVCEEYLELLKMCEKYSFRVYNVCGKRPNTGRSRLERAAHDAEWAGRSEKYQEVFDKRPTRDLNTREIVVENTSNRMRSHAESKHAPLTAVVEYLRFDDTRNGGEDEDWSGVRSDNVIKYICFKFEILEYDPSFDADRGPGDLFEDLYPEVPNSTTLEHIHPDHSDDIDKTAAREDVDDTTLDDLVNSIGNLTILHKEANSVVQDLDYEGKYREVYNEYKLQQVSNLPRDWDVERLRARRENLIDAVKEFSEF